MPLLALAVAIALVVTYVWWKDRQPDSWRSATYGATLTFENRFFNLGGEGLGISAPGTVLRNGWADRRNPGWDEAELHWNGFIFSVIEPPEEYAGLEGDGLVRALRRSWQPPEAAESVVAPAAVMIGGRPGVTFGYDLRIDGVGWRLLTWRVPCRGVWYDVVVQARVNDWDEEAGPLTEAAESLRITTSP